MFGIIEQHKNRMDVDLLEPAINWRRTTNQASPSS
jgi:hypothetical protein